MPTEELETQLSQRDIVAAATNDPTLSDNTILVGDRTFTIVDLPYDDYITFLSKLQPLMEAVAGKLSFLNGVVDTGSQAITPSALMKYCLADLPEMCHIVLRQSDSSVTVEEVKTLGKTPFKLATVVLKQIEQNHIIKDVADFFVQVLPLISAGRRLMTGATL